MCVDLDNLVGRFSKSVACICFGMQHERQMVRDKLKKREQKKVLGEDNSSDIEFVERGSAAVKRRHVEQEPEAAERRPLQRQ
jgi:hypothetical protein